MDNGEIVENDSFCNLMEKKEHIMICIGAKLYFSVRAERALQ